MKNHTLSITYFPSKVVPNDKQVEVFKNIKSATAAKNVVHGRTRGRVMSAFYKDSFKKVPN